MIELQPSFTVGVTGHRPHRLRIGPAVLLRQCLDVLSSIARGSRSCRHVAISALAEGADRAFTEAALTARYELHAVLPFVSNDYEKTFSDRGGLPTYKHLLAAAARVKELPGSLTAANDAYADVGREIIMRADIIVAIWDDKPGQGKGGTPDVIEMALGARKPVIWIDANGQKPRRVLVPPRAGSGVPLEILKGRARRLQPRRVRDLASRLSSKLRASPRS